MALDQKNQLLNLFHEKNRPTLTKWPQVDKKLSIKRWSTWVEYPPHINNIEEGLNENDSCGEIVTGEIEVWGGGHAWRMITQNNLLYSVSLGHRCALHSPSVFCGWVEKIHQVCLFPQWNGQTDILVVIVVSLWNQKTDLVLSKTGLTLLKIVGHEYQTCIISSV